MENKADFDVLFRRYYSPLYYYAYHLTQDLEVSKDIASDAFESIWSNYSRIEKDTVQSYLYVYVRNKCINFLRHQSVKEQHAEFYAMLTQDVEDTEYRNERIALIVQAMEKLTPYTRYILEECYVEHKKYQEVADELNISINAVKKHIVKALAILRKECSNKT